MAGAAEIINSTSSIKTSILILKIR